ncbi:O-antigen ligase family protein [Pontibacter sp. KCTC 32443]|uniref:O-antigen ligase family protein n=1 Tax=Pontibacter TaxID=323449 RepID=UPI00164DEB06|nr:MULTISPECIES: O-antigen ligase family protein [Pontibacter]MBC5774890.1 O-antigen ligase family protein [Pontibacter sp. KCTC 32443]
MKTIAPAKTNIYYLALLLLSIGAIFLKTPKFYGVSISDVAVLFTIVALVFNGDWAALRLKNYLLPGLIFLFLLYLLPSVFVVPDKLLFLKYFTRLAKSALMGMLAYVLMKNLDEDLQFRFIKFFFYFAIICILIDTVYSFILYFVNLERNMQFENSIWVIYAALKASFLYSEKNMVAFTMSLLMVMSWRFFDGKFLFLLWLLTLIFLSRSGMVVNTLLLFYFIGAKLFKPKYMLMLLGTLLLTVALVYLFNMQELFINRLTLTQDLSMQGRLNLQKIGINLWLESPLFGKGLSGYEQNFARHFTGGEYNPYPHNLFIYILAEFGIVGFLLLGTIFYLLYQRLNKRKLGMLLVAYLLFGIFLFNLTEYHFFFLAGVLAAFTPKLTRVENSIHTPVVS